MRPLILLLAPLLCLSCYTRFNHALIMAEGRVFTPDAASDCRSCHEREVWLTDLEPGIGVDGQLDHWQTFRAEPWWRGSTVPVYVEAAAPAPSTPPPAAPENRPLVMGDVPGPHLPPALVDSSAAPPRDNGDEPPRRPRKHNRRPVKLTQPAPQDTTRKGS